MATTTMSIASRSRKVWSAGHMAGYRALAGAADGLGHPHRLDRLGHVVGADDVGAAQHRRRGRRQRARAGARRGPSTPATAPMNDLRETPT